MSSDLSIYASESTSVQAAEGSNGDGPTYHPPPNSVDDRSYTTIQEVNKSCGSGGNGWLAIPQRMLSMLSGSSHGKTRDSKSHGGGNNILPGLIAAIVVYAVLKFSNTAPLTDKGINLSALHWKSIVLSCVLAMIVFVIVKKKLNCW